MVKNYDDKIKLFTTLAGSVSLISANTAEAQTVITRDISPDVVVNSAAPSYSIDIDNDGTTDFTIVQNTYSYGGSTSTFFYFLGTGSIGTNLPTAGMSNAHTFVSASGYDWYVAKLNVGDTTKYTTEYNDNLYTRLFSATNGSLGSDYQWTAGTTDKYVGVQFTIGTNVHFGWVKLDIAADYSSVTVKEVGYESAPSALMKAGATVSADKVSAVYYATTGSAGNASDVNISFPKAANEANILKYRAYLVPTASVSTMTLAFIQELPATNYQEIPKTGSGISVNLSSTLLDVLGNAYNAATPYSVFVESVGDNSTGDALSVASTTVINTGISNSNGTNSNVYSEGNSIHIKQVSNAGNVKITNLVGAEVYNGSINQGDNKITLENIVTGVYFVTLKHNEETITQKVFIQK